MKTTLIITRHGTTAWNKAKRLQGTTDIPLNNEGKDQARQLALYLPKIAYSIDFVYTSALSRAVDTGKIVAQALDIEVLIESGLNERKYGIWEGKTWAEVDSDYKKTVGPEAKSLNRREVTPFGGESGIDFRNRIISTLRKIAKAHDGKTIFIVTHGGVLHILIRYLRNIPDHEEFDFHFPNTSLSVFTVEDEIITEESIGDISHLEKTNG